ncbi:hypothetical protein JCM19233_1689 [Vibrio astriarenae]|uniref:DUF1127 domain-containing protein n=1 Tax=Vibrio astriarenae TaxID=1481923 RepID=A0A7Z2T493_9VIBR|nr:DUF1127 domain-containing protein [Vibrio astriarenae]QIA64094.1 DUF1127 domain-containing protein [Vibrio astriarenae]GAL10712.1 hypothetical protein JCM19233_1689 [Vibrio sp. C7]
MRHSIYLKLAAWLVVADLKQEERAWQRRVRKSAHHLPFHSAHLLRDIGLDLSGRPIGKTEAPKDTAERRVRHLRRVLQSRTTT